MSDAVAAGASNSREVAAMCGAGSDCGRCRCTVRSIIATVSESLCPPGAKMLELV